MKLSAEIITCENELARHGRVPKEADDVLLSFETLPHLFHFWEQYANNMQTRPYARRQATWTKDLQRLYTHQDGNH